MLNPAEKAYLQALHAVKRKEYRRAVQFFDQAAPFFRESREFVLLRETTCLLVAVKEEIRGPEAGKTNEEQIEVEEFYYGKENGLRPEV